MLHILLTGTAVTAMENVYGGTIPFQVAIAYSDGTRVIKVPLEDVESTAPTLDIKSAEGFRFVLPAGAWDVAMEPPQA